MEQKNYIKRFCICTVVLFAAIFAVWHILDFHIIEANLFEEIAKRVFVSAGVIGIVVLPLTAYIIAPFCYHTFHENRKK